MSDDTLSAGDLRRRYGPGGSIPDSELTASQLKARYGIPKNDKDFSSKPVVEQVPMSSVAVIAGAVAVAIALAFVLYSMGVFA
mmetsp:Transcript_29607/g.68453  ORF Transcript_29607/g.68453 Transcript_29607/m.68453 type:complete len:83 (+) Transcript_29607:2-250(+)